MCLDQYQPIYVNTIWPTHMLIVYVIYACTTSCYIDVKYKIIELAVCFCVFLWMCIFVVRVVVVYVSRRSIFNWDQNKIE